MGTRRAGASAAVVGAALLISSTTIAGTTQPDESARGKEWVAMGSARGAAAAEESGVTVIWSGEILGAFRFTVDDAGLVAGEWGLVGDGTQEVSVAGVTVTGDLEYSGGGALGGDESTLVATGSATTTGVVRPIGQQINNTNELPPLAIDVEVYCNEMWGSWELTVADAFEDAGFSGAAGSTSFDGTFVGHVRYEGFSDEAIAELNEHGFSMETLNSWSGDYSLAERVEFELVTIQAHLAAVASAEQRLSETYPNWTGPDAYAVIDQIHTLLNVLRNLSGCARGALGEGTVERWTDGLHQVLENLVFKLVELELYPGRPPRPQAFTGAAIAPVDEEVPDPGQATLAYLQLVDFAMRSAVFGAGALDASTAAEAEQALIDAGSRLLTDLDAAGGTDDDRRRLLVAGALMGWQFDVGGAPVDAAAALAELGLGS